MKEFVQTSFINLSEFEPMAAIGDIEEDLQGEDSPASITPECQDHCWRAYMRTDVEMTWVCDCGETKTELSPAEYIELWRHHSENMRLALESAIVSPTDQTVQHHWRRVSIEQDILRYIVPNLPAFLPSQKSFDNSSKPVIEEVKDKVKVDGLNQYKCKGSENKYWRYSYRINGRLKHLHIKGGNERTPLIKKRVTTLQALIDGGTTHEAIAKLIKSW